MAKLFTAAVVATTALASTARGQAVDRRYVEEPTDGIALPTAPLAGEFDGRVVSSNPGGLSLVRGSELALALDLEDHDVATSGPGFGGFLALATGGGLLPRIGVGVGLEWLRPARQNLTPDPGEAFRFTLASAVALGGNAGLGLAWHRFSADGALAGASSFDVGLSARIGNRFAFGAVLRDIATSPIADSPVQRRYEGELLVRPLATDRLDVALGGRVGETRGDIDGWLRTTAKLTRGVYAHAAVESREVFAVVDSPSGSSEQRGRELRATLGFEVSFGSFGVTGLASGLRDDTAANHPLGGQLIVRLSSIGPESVLQPSAHIERLELAGEISTRELTGLVGRLRAIARDSSVRALVITFDDARGGWATMQELRDELVRVRRTGKKVFAYLVSAGSREYFVASAADRIYLDPAGELQLTGFANTTIYFRGAFDHVGILPQFEKIAEFKSAPEQFTETGPSPDAARMASELYDSIWEQWLAAVAEARKLAPADLRAIVDRGPYSAGDLANSANPATKLIDAVAVPDKVSELVAKELGRPFPLGTLAVNRPDRWQRPGIAVIYVDGDIAGGKSKSIPLRGDVAGGETLVAALAAARSDSRVGAIVLRIDSPGGSALASELIAREVFATRGVKPIICSMSDLAASGGYFVAAGCDRIFAEPMTITGSIGIFTGKFDVSGLLKKLGASTGTNKRGKRADIDSMYRPYSDEERAVVLEKIRYSYGRFLGAVAEGRGMKKEDVDAIGRGHVWSGSQAKPIKLVDQFGGLADAIDYAKSKIGLASETVVDVIELPRPTTNLIGRLTGLVRASSPPTDATATLDAIPGVRELLRVLPMSVIAEPNVPQARLPYELNLEATD